MTEITQLLSSADKGDSDARRALFEVVYEELCEMARLHMRREKSEHTLQPTALVHEAYLRIFREPSESDSLPTRWEGRRHFFGAAANAMRQILIEVARRKQTEKHGGDYDRVLLNLDDLGTAATASQLLLLDEALTQLEETEPRSAELVNLRFFAGLTLKEAAEQLSISPRTADSDWAYAKAWLLSRMSE